ncbi:MAG TPA: serine/threonine-protein kinase [Polyangiaceae bacterium]|nr:serine/threonine-protein kinase [Polyangiaceae bacterium]
MTSVAAPIDSGTAVGPYVVERPLAQGGMSVLYVAREAGDAAGGARPRVVLKMLLPEVATAATRARLLREARALSLVDHPGVVRVHGTGEHEGMPWIAMDLVQGTDLKHVIADQGHLPVDAGLGYAIQIAEALEAAHNAGVVHRDLKPSNVLLTPERRIVLVDFGIAKRRGEAREGDVLTSAREVIGTPAYLSPEQLDHGLADERSDIWALGCLLYEMLVGVPPFGRGGSATTAAIIRDEPFFPSHIPADVASVISSCLRKNSFARVATPRELLVLLHDAATSARPGDGSGSTRFERTSSSTRPASPRSGARIPSPPPPPPHEATFQGSLPRRPSGSPPAPASRTSAPPPAPRASSPPAASRTSAPPPASRTSAPPTRSPSPSSPPKPRSTAPPPAPSGAVRPSTTRGRIKGTAIRAATAWFVEIYGEAAMDRVIERCAPGPKPRVRDPLFGVMASGWYETQLVGRFVRALEQEAAPADPAEFVDRLGAAIARDNVNGVYRALFRLVASPQLLEANAQRVWQTYSDEGTFSVRRIDTPQPASFEATIRGWTHHHEGVCRLIAPIAEHALRALGYGTVVVGRRSCLAHGGTVCVYEGRWG